jgi:hypothetical protein
MYVNVGKKELGNELKFCAQVTCLDQHQMEHQRNVTEV